ncbi:MAG: pitrilysin family protein, partial [Planctomycetota bacterium]
MTEGFQTHQDPILGEEVLLATAQNGLPVRVVATDRFREAVAVITFDYGSIDLGYRQNGKVHGSPEGVAHYLEHKLFEDEELQAFDRFAQRGARVNAMTGFASTSYFFTATDRFGENLEDLLHLVSHAHITPENVDKERGIIAQEIQMYEDSPDYRAFFDLLGCLYQQHPVRHPVGGTVESIQEITPAELLSCYDAFYRTGNAALAVAGPIDPEEALDLASACGL